MALVESPAQLLNAIEYGHVKGILPSLQVLVLANGEERNRQQLRAMADLAAQASIEVTWVEPRTAPSRRFTETAAIRRTMARAQTLVIGDPFSGLVQALLLTLRRRPPIVVVDDGTSTMEFVDRVAEGRPLLRWHRPVGRSGPVLRTQLARSATRCFSAAAGPIEVFTLWPTRPVPHLTVIDNDYAWLRARFPAPQVTPGLDIVGTSLVESGIVEQEALISGLADLTRDTGAGRYYAHRREAPDKLAAISARTGLHIVHPELPLEVTARRGPVARTVLSFPSSVTRTLPRALQGSGVEVTMIPIPESWILPEARTSAVFLDTISKGVDAPQQPESQRDA